MNLAELQRKLMSAARRNAPADRVPYAFEKRIMALVQSRPVPDPLAVWAHALWRSAGACLAVMLVFGAITFFRPAPAPAAAGLSEDFENTLLAAVDQETDLPQ